MLQKILFPAILSIAFMGETFSQYQRYEDSAAPSIQDISTDAEDRIGPFLFIPDVSAIQSSLEDASKEFATNKASAEITLPDEFGNPMVLLALESSVMSSDMESRFPDFKTYILSHVSDGSFAGRLFMSPFGVEGMVRKEGKMIKFEALDRANPTIHQAFIWEKENNVSCEHGHHHHEEMLSGAKALPTPNGATRRTYEIAIATTGEFYQSASFGNNDLTTANAAIVNIVNLVNVAYNSELAIHLTIFGSPQIFTDPATDGIDPAGSRTTIAQSVISTAYPSNTYDLGHILHAMGGGGSGVAGLGVVCNSSNKASGWSGGDSQSTLAVAIMIHEVGHMFNAPHTFNGTGSNCTAQISATNAVEIGSGTTLMSYAGLCQADNNIQSSPDNYYFHTRSLENILTYISGTGGTCPSTTTTGNTPPTVNANPCAGSYTIPKLTPFSIEGSATDPDAGQSLTYTWEQIDEDGAGTPTQGFLGTTAGNSAIAPLFRSYPPSASGNKRTFPAISTILNTANVATFEPLPNAARTLNFRLTARDNFASNGGTGYGELAVVVSATAGPLAVTSPNTAVTWSAGSQTVTWAVNNTNTLFANVDILLSLDGGQSFPITLVSNTANDGTETITLASFPNSTQARVKVRYLANSCFEVFDVSDVNFTISSSCAVSPSNICATSALTAPSGDPSLALGLTSIFGNVGSTTSLSIESTDPNISISRRDGVSCEASGFNNKYRTATMIVGTTGTYRFTIAGSASFAGINVYQAASFNPASPCAGWVGSNYSDGGGGFTNIASSVDIALSACTPYTVVFTNLNAATPFTTGFNASGPGTMVISGTAPSAPYNGYTYIAVNTSTNVVAGESSTSNFTSLTAGNYNIYGVNYNTSLTPSSWISQNLGTLLSSGACMLTSTNSKLVTVTQDCNLDFVNLQSPGSGTVDCASTFTAYGQVYEPGVTPGAGAQGAGVEVEFGYHTSNTDPATWTNWVAATFNALGGGANNDEYMYVFTPPSTSTYYYTFRYRKTGCPWQYGGFSGGGGGTWNGTTNNSGVLTVNAPINWANLQWPPSGNICPNGTFDAYGKVYEPGVTEAAGQGAGIAAEFGYSTSNTNPNTWSDWAVANFQGDSGNDDEYKYTFSPPSAGTYYYAFRYKKGTCDWQYGGYNGGFWGGGNVNGVLTVNSCLHTNSDVCTTSATATGVTGASWFHIVDGSGNRIASINPQGNNLGNVTVQVRDFATVPTDGQPGFCGTAPGQPYLPRYFNFNCTGTNPFASTVKVRLYYLNQELTAYNSAMSSYGCATINRAELDVTHYDGPTEDCIVSNNAFQGSLIAASSINDIDFGSDAFYLEFDVNRFSEMGAAKSNGNPLPIELIYFKGQKANEASTLLEWRTATETDNAYFAIERSADGVNFEEIGSVGAAGHSRGNLDYKFIDREPMPGNNYYRLRQVDFNGSSTNSHVVVVNFEKGFSVNISPNPSNDKFNIDIYAENGGDASVEVFDLLGRSVQLLQQTIEMGNTRVQIGGEELVGGSYMVRVKAGDRVVTTIVVKNR